ncbi:MAG: acyl-CoA dehydrogenase family protein [Planctomycetota bacterium]
MAETSTARPKGGSFLIQQIDPEATFTPEDFSEEQRMIAQTTRDFLEGEVLPQLERIEHKDFDATIELMRKAGELGLLSVSIPEQYGGLELDQACAMLVSEHLAKCGSFAVSHGGHTGIGSLPIVYFGTPEQKEHYLPKLATGELLAAYALTEASSGSDALAAKATAVLEGDEWVLNGEKMWITNAAFADVFITFAKVDGEHFSCFIVEKSDAGVSTGKEEQKMGIEGSSTRTLILESARIPKSRLLGEIGKGHKIAFNILNIGRFKLGAGAIGAARACLDDSVKYASERQQFGKPISSFGAIQQMIANMAIGIWVGESMVYRTAGLIDQALADVDKSDPQAVLKEIEEYAIECSIIKVSGSETLDRIVDDGVQIYGGYGYSKEYPVERYYRDSRINRIFEGTNEINRMLIPGMLVKRAQKGELPLLQAAKKIQDELLEPPSFEDEETGVLVAETKLIEGFKKLALLVSGVAVQKFLMSLQEQQEVLLGISDIIQDVYAAESALLRAKKLIAAKGEAGAKLQILATQVFVNDAADRIEVLARNTLASAAEGDELRTMLAAARRFTKRVPVDPVKPRREVAQAQIEAGKYCLS